MTEPRAARDLDHRSLAILGLLTICAYGSWYYAFGVLLDPIKTDTGWRESSLTASFSAGTVVVGLTSLLGGRLLDRAGHRVVFCLAGALAGGGLFVASTATSVVVFVLGAAVGLGASGSLGFYHVTMTTAVRLNPNNSTRAISVLTIWGALASAIFLPSTAVLVDAVGWRDTVRVLAAITTAAFWIAALSLPTTRAQSFERPPLAAIVRSTIAPGAPRYLTSAIAFGGIAMSTMLVYQVPARTAAGLPATTAATMAGLRGFAQLGGRLPLAPIVERLGIDRALTVAFVAITAGGALLSISGTRVVAVIFAVVAGFGIGAFSPLQGMRATELFDHDNLGATMGFYGATLLLAGSVGPLVAGILADASGDRRWASVIVVGAGLGAIVSVRRLASSRPAAVLA